MFVKSGNAFAAKIIFCSGLSFVIGIFFGLILRNAFWLIGSVFLFLVLVSFFLLKKSKWVFIISLIFFSMGFMRAECFQKDNFEKEVEKFFGAEVEISGIIIKEPDINQGSQKIIVKLEEINNQKIATQERILAFVPFYPRYEYGQSVEISGKIEKPPEFEGFDYREYLFRQGIFAVSFSPEIKIIGNGNHLSLSQRFFQGILAMKNKLRESIYRNFSVNSSLLLGAIILGDKSRLSPELEETLNKAGIRHLTAISGMHVMILMNILMLGFLGLGLWRKQAFFLTIIFILFFIIFTGFQASTIRAGIMGFLYLFGQILGRQSDSSRAIVFGAAVMLAFNPFLLNNIGFQLSFLAVLGINYLFPIFSRWLRRIPNFLELRNVLAMSLAAQIFTLPILISNFGYISLVAPITNVLILPLLPFILVFGFLSALFGLFAGIFALIFIFPCWLILSYLQIISNFFASLAFSSISLKISWVWIIFYYLFLSYLIIRWKKDHRFRIAGF
ncbi:ComEC family competence protein [Patescibacteria group bacterium]|nr:ComEC family competence protein [Patescibacteria group bacterium]